MLKSNDIVYISGPMSDLPNSNRNEFNTLEKRIVAVFGCRVLNPARHPDGLSYCEYMKRAMSDLDNSSVIVLLPNWKDSAGAICERLIAFKAGKRIVEQRHLFKNKKQRKAESEE